MKKIIPPLFLLPLLLGGCGDTSADAPVPHSTSSGKLRVEEFEDDRRDGKAFRMRQTYRGDALILGESWQGEKFSRIYYIDGRAAWGESDETGDGHLETINVWAADGSVGEAFTRDKAGRVTPFSDDKLAVLQAEVTAAQERKLRILDDARRAVEEEQAAPGS